MKKEANPIAQYLIDLASDPEKLEAFKANPDVALDTTGLSASDKEVVKSGDSGKIGAALSDGTVMGETVVVIDVIVVVADELAAPEEEDEYITSAIEAS